MDEPVDDERAELLTDHFRDAPLMIVGEGTNEIQRNVIAGQLVTRGGLGPT